MERSFQEYYPQQFRHCYGCGTENKHGLQLKSYWDGELSVAVFQPEQHHTAVPGVVYGGLLASLIDCHSTGTAAAAVYRAEGRDQGTEPVLRFVTASLHVDYLHPTPLGPEIELHAEVTEIKGKKVVIKSQVKVEGKITAKGKVVAVQIPENFSFR